MSDIMDQEKKDMVDIANLQTVDVMYTICCCSNISKYHAFPNTAMAFMVVRK